MPYDWKKKHPYTEPLWHAAREIIETCLDEHNFLAVAKLQQNLTKALQVMEEKLNATTEPSQEVFLDGLARIVKLIDPKRLQMVKDIDPAADTKLTTEAVEVIVDAVRSTLEAHVPSGTHEHARAQLLRRLDKTQLALTKNAENRTL